MNSSYMYTGIWINCSLIWLHTFPHFCIIKSLNSHIHLVELHITKYLHNSWRLKYAHTCLCDLLPIAAGYYVRRPYLFTLGKYWRWPVQVCTQAAAYHFLTNIQASRDKYWFCVRTIYKHRGAFMPCMDRSFSIKVFYAPRGVIRRSPLIPGSTDTS